MHRISQESRIRARASFLPCLCLSYTPSDHRPKELVGRCPIHLSTCRLFAPTPTSRPRWTSHRECLASTCSTSKVSGQWLRRAGPDSLFFSPDQGRPHSDPTLSLLYVVVVGGVVSQGGGTSMSSVRLVGGRAPAQPLHDIDVVAPPVPAWRSNPGPVTCRSSRCLPPHHPERRCRAENHHVGLPCSFEPLSPRLCVSHPSHPTPFRLEDVRLMACQVALAR